MTLLITRCDEVCVRMIMALKSGLVRSLELLWSSLKGSLKAICFNLGRLKLRSHPSIPLHLFLISNISQVGTRKVMNVCVCVCVCVSGFVFCCVFL